tara:strand:- start:307 stop:669 length:363 start_codon:yes stop_codon:yes gene_type:complete
LIITLLYSSGDFIKDESHLKQCIEILGKFPLDSVVRKGERSSDWFDMETGTFRPAPQVAHHPAVLNEILVETFQLQTHEAHMLESLIKAALTYDPHERPTAMELLLHPFFSDFPHTHGLE